MAKQPSTQLSRTRSDGAPSTRALQRQIGRTRESLTETVEEIKQTAEQGYKSAKQTVAQALDYRKEFQKEPLVWSLGALSAGFAIGYTLGYAHKTTKRGKHSAIVQYADKMVDGLSTIGQSLVIPELDDKIRGLFGLDFSGFLKDMRGTKTHSRRPAKARRVTNRSRRTRRTNRSR